MDESDLLNKQSKRCSAAFMSIDDVVAKVDAVTPEDVQRVARKFLVTEKFNLAIIGPVKSAAPLQRLLEKRGGCQTAAPS